jgi:Ca-activated chloride channel family protein
VNVVTHVATAVAVGVFTTAPLGLIARADEGECQQPIRVGIDLVNFGVVVTDKHGAPITGLTADDFEVLEKGKPQRVTFFASGDAALAPPLRLGFLLDTSGSMEADMKDVRTAAIKFLNQNEHAVDVTLVDFDTEVRVSRYGPNEFPRLIERIRRRQPEGYTALYDALGVYLSGAASLEGQKVLVAYTDGGDTRSSMNAGEVADLLKASDVTLYVIGYLEHQSSSVRTSARMELQRFAALTGGQAFFPTHLKDVDGMYEKIQQEIAARYNLGYTSTDERADGTWREVRIRLKRPDLRGAKLRTRAGYFAPYRVGSR